MKFSTARRHIREGSKNIIRNSWMTVASVGAVTTTLILVGIFLTLILNLNQVAENIEEDVEMTVYAELTAGEEELNELEQNLSELQNIRSLDFSSKEEELEKLVEDMGDTGEQWGSVFEDSNPLNDAFYIKANQATQYKSLSEQIQGMDYVDEVSYSQTTVENLLSFNQYARYIGIGFISALLLTAIFLISNTIKMTIIARQEEIGIMKLVGAKNSFIRWPFFVEGALMGVLGSIIPIGIVIGGYYYLYENFNDKINMAFVELLPFNPFALQISLILLGIGVFIGIWGSVMSVRKFLNV
ncbi:permease-like cell division protein FtsX [Aquisalibacillus elongatus]|uniref:Cell division protein FtsX n=1 Tax=Aquisalibacillus elongatus TaxID=485577 RepID=A0A3N5BAD7_9BACI|nr:permease-like cell division protein FtsX [Aquisalibacillus elongatus]RPF54373.1 cell division protein FtsX [Aquisalibacillus elongatus]